MKPGYARHHLIPHRIARVVPYAAVYHVKPFRYIPPATEFLRVEGPGKQAPVSKKSAAPAREPTPLKVLDQLHTLPDTLTFPLRTIDRLSHQLHGSLTLSDVAARLKELDITEGDFDVTWKSHEAGDRMKETGERTAIIAVRGKGRESVEIQIRVISLDDVNLA